MPKPRAARIIKKLADGVLRFDVKAPVAWVKRIEDWRRQSAWSAAKRRNTSLVSEALDHYDKKKKKAKDASRAAAQAYRPVLERGPAQQGDIGPRDGGTLQRQRDAAAWPIRGRVLPVHGAIDLFKGRRASARWSGPAVAIIGAGFLADVANPAGSFGHVEEACQGRYRSIANQALGRRLWHARAGVWRR
jgi:hypothetical protein